MQSPFLLLAILGCLTCAKLGDTDNNDLAADDSNSAALSPVLVADGGDDPGTALWRDVEETVRGLWRGSQDDMPAPKNPTISQPNSNRAAPEDSPGSVPKPDCITVNGEKYWTPVCCIDNDPTPVPLTGPLFDTPIFWSLSLCSQCNPHVFFSLSTRCHMWNLSTRPQW